MDKNIRTYAVSSPDSLDQTYVRTFSIRTYVRTFSVRTLLGTSVTTKVWKKMSGHYAASSPDSLGQTYVRTLLGTSVLTKSTGICSFEFGRSNVRAFSVWPLLRTSATKVWTKLSGHMQFRVRTVWIKLTSGLYWGLQ